MNVETAIITWLSGTLQVPVSGEEVQNATRFVTVEKTGSYTEDLLETATLAVQSWAESREAAAALNGAVKAAMELAPTLDSVSRCHCESDYNYTDDRKKKHRYQAVFEVVFYDTEGSES